MKRILIVFGGCSTEHEVSCQSARAVVDSLRRERYVPVIVGITRAGRWLYCGDEPDWDRWRERGTPCTLSLDRGAGRLLLEGGGAVDFDAAFPILHGKNGEDGTVQGLIELIGVPLIGCGALCSAHWGQEIYILEPAQDGAAQAALLAEIPEGHASIGAC